MYSMYNRRAEVRVRLAITIDEFVTSRWPVRLAGTLHTIECASQSVIPISQPYNSLPRAEGDRCETQPFARMILCRVPRSTYLTVHCTALHVLLNTRHTPTATHQRKTPRLLLVVTRGPCCSRWLSPKTPSGGQRLGCFLSMT
jgi:hypothetical protein